MLPLLEVAVGVRGRLLVDAEDAVDAVGRLLPLQRLVAAGRRVRDHTSGLAEGWGA